MEYDLVKYIRSLFNKNRTKEEDEKLDWLLLIEAKEALQRENDRLIDFIEINYVGRTESLLNKIKMYEEYIKEIDDFKLEVQTKIRNNMTSDMGLRDISKGISCSQTEIIIFPEKIFAIERNRI